MKLHYKSKRGPTPGKPKPQEAKVVRMVNSGMSQQQIADSLNMPDEDPKRKIRRVMRKIEAATHSRTERRTYERCINKGLIPKDRLVIFSADYDAFVAFPELVEPCSPRLVTVDELFRLFDETHAAFIDSLTKKQPDAITQENFVLPV